MSLQIFLDRLGVIRPAIINDAYHPATVEEIDPLFELVQIPFPGPALHWPNVVNEIALNGSTVP